MHQCAVLKISKNDDMMPVKIDRHKVLHWMSDMLHFQNISMITLITGTHNAKICNNGGWG